MARSSGGGRSGGGCHSGGGGGGGHSSSSGSSHHHTYSSHSFPDSRRYSYTDAKGEKQYIYCSHHPADIPPLPWLIYLVCLVMMIGTLYTLWKEAEFRPQHLENPFSEIYIDDRQNVIKDKEVLKQKLTAFYEKTGVTPAVETVNEEQWRETHPSLMSYAMDEYYRLFEDENHWLIVYSRGRDSAGNLTSVIWSFEGIIGDDTEDSISDWMCSVFTTQTYRNLGYLSDPGKAIGLSFTLLRMLWKVGFLSQNFFWIYMSLDIILFWNLPLMKGIYNTVRAKKYIGAVLDDEIGDKPHTA